MRALRLCGNSFVSGLRQSTKGVSRKGAKSQRNRTRNRDLESWNSLQQIIDSYDPNAPLSEAWTIPAPWYTDKQLYDLELKTVFARSWQFAARADQLCEPGRYVTTEIAGEPIVVVRGSDAVLRGFFNVCRHHAAAVMTEPEGSANQLRCPYHGWTYALDGELKGTPDFAGVCNFDRAANGLVPVEIATWEKWAFARVERGTGVRALGGARGCRALAEGVPGPNPHRSNSRARPRGPSLDGAAALHV